MELNTQKNSFGSGMPIGGPKSGIPVPTGKENILRKPKLIFNPSKPSSLPKMSGDSLARAASGVEVPEIQGSAVTTCASAPSLHNSNSSNNTTPVNSNVSSPAAAISNSIVAAAAHAAQQESSSDSPVPSSLTLDTPNVAKVEIEAAMAGPLDQTVTISQKGSGSLPGSLANLFSPLLSSFSALGSKQSDEVTPSESPLNNIILAKMKANKQKSKSQQSTPTTSPIKASRAPASYLGGKTSSVGTAAGLCDAVRRSLESPASHLRSEPQLIMSPIERCDDVFEGEGQSDASVGSIPNSRPCSACSERIDTPETNELVEQNFRQLFEELDEYKTGMVTANVLIGRLQSFLDNQAISLRKINDFRCMLDPHRDNRLVSAEEFVEIGKEWVMEILNEENYNVKEVGHQEVHINRDHYDMSNASFGSLEGVGEVPICTSLQPELEHRCGELQFQLLKEHEKNSKLTQALANAEENIANLGIQLEQCREQIFQLSHHGKGSNVFMDFPESVTTIVAACEEETPQNNFLMSKVEEMKSSLKEKDDQVSEWEAMCEDLRKQYEVAAKRESQTAVMLDHRTAELERVVEELESKKADLSDLSKQVETMHRKIDDLKYELNLKEEEARAIEQVIGATSEKPASLGNASVNGSNINDVSVDDKVLEDLNSSNSPTPQRICPANIQIQRRGPSASSTPARPKFGSIGDEIKDMEPNSSFASPLCEKINPANQNPANRILVSRLQNEIKKMQENVRRAVITESKESESGKLINAINKAMAINTKDLANCQDFDEDIFEPEGQNSLRNLLEQEREECNRLRDELDALKKKVEDRSILKEEDERKDIDIEVIESRVAEMVSILQASNRAILAKCQRKAEGGDTRSASSAESPDISAEEDLLSHWQLDLEGLELVEHNFNLSKKLIQYSKLLREKTCSDESASQPAGGYRRIILSSLYTKLEELHSETEKSRDLLVQAGESIREDISTEQVNNSKQNITKTSVECQTDFVAPCQNERGIAINTSECKEAVDGCCQTDFCLAEEEEEEKAKGEGKAPHEEQALVSNPLKSQELSSPPKRGVWTTIRNMIFGVGAFTARDVRRVEKSLPRHVEDEPSIVVEEEGSWLLCSLHEEKKPEQNEFCHLDHNNNPVKQARAAWTGLNASGKGSSLESILFANNKLTTIDALMCPQSVHPAFYSFLFALSFGWSGRFISPKRC